MQRFPPLDFIVGAANLLNHLPSLPDGGSQFGIFGKQLFILFCLFLLLFFQFLLALLLFFFTLLRLLLHIQILIVHLIGEHQAGLLVVDVRARQHLFANHLLQIAQHEIFVPAAVPYQHINRAKLAGTDRF